MRVWATAWDVFRRAPSRVGHGVRVAVYFVVCFWVGRIFIGFLFLFLMRPFFAFRTKKPLHTGVRTGCHYLVSLFVCVCVCVTFVLFTDCESCTMPVSTNSGSMEAGEYGLTRRTCFVARRLELVATAALLWISWCVLGAARCRVLFPSNAHGLLQV